MATLKKPIVLDETMQSVKNVLSSIQTAIENQNSAYVEKSTTSATPTDTDKFIGEGKYFTGSNVNKYIQLQMAAAPSCYKRPNIMTLNKTTVTIPADTWVNINGTGYISETDTTLNLSTAGTASNRAGKDVYVYACTPSSGTEPAFILSLNSTVPTGYTATTSRKIGGFHCLCLDVGSISGHTLSGYATGDALPNSQWDLLHRAASENEGMVFISQINKWVDIYLASVSNSKLVSTYKGTIADGSSDPSFNGEKFSEWLGLVNKRPLWRQEFQVAAKGSNECTNISGSSDPVTTGGHIDTSSRRMISNYGLEDCCGVSWQFLNDTPEYYPGATFSDSDFWLSGYSWNIKSVYNSSIDNQTYGSCNGMLRRLLAGGGWGNGSLCGSRSLACYILSSLGRGDSGVRGVSELRVVSL